MDIKNGLVRGFLKVIGGIWAKQIDVETLKANVLEGAAINSIRSSISSLQSLTTQLNSDFGNLIFTASSDKPTSGYSVSEDSYVHRSAVGQVDLFCDVQAATVQNTWHTVAFIPAGYRPLNYKCVQCIVFDTNSNPFGLRCFIYSDGNIKVFNHLTTGTYKLRIFGSYFVSK